MPWSNGACLAEPPCTCVHACTHGVGIVLKSRGRPPGPTAPVLGVAPPRDRPAERFAAAMSRELKDKAARETKKSQTTPEMQQRLFVELLEGAAPELASSARVARAERGLSALHDYTPTTIQVSRSRHKQDLPLMVGLLANTFEALTTLACGSLNGCGCTPPCAEGKHASAWACEASDVVHAQRAGARDIHADMLRCVLVALAEMYRKTSRGSDFRRMSIAILRHASTIGSTRIPLHEWNEAFEMAAGETHDPFEIGEYSWTKGSKDAAALLGSFDLDRTIYTRDPGMPVGTAEGIVQSIHYYSIFLAHVKMTMTSVDGAQHTVAGAMTKLSMAAIYRAYAARGKELDIFVAGKSVFKTVCGEITHGRLDVKTCLEYNADHNGRELANELRVFIKWLQSIGLICELQATALVGAVTCYENWLGARFMSHTLVIPVQRGMLHDLIHCARRALAATGVMGADAFADAPIPAAAGASAADAPGAAQVGPIEPPMPAAPADDSDGDSVLSVDDDADVFFEGAVHPVILAMVHANDAVVEVAVAPGVAAAPEDARFDFTCGGCALGEVVYRRLIVILEDGIIGVVAAVQQLPDAADLVAAAGRIAADMHGLREPPALDVDMRAQPNGDASAVDGGDAPVYGGVVLVDRDAPAVAAGGDEPAHGGSVLIDVEAPAVLGGDAPVPVPAAPGEAPVQDVAAVQAAAVAARAHATELGRERCTEPVRGRPPCDVRYSPGGYVINALVLCAMCLGTATAVAAGPQYAAACAAAIVFMPRSVSAGDKARGLSNVKALQARMVDYMAHCVRTSVQIAAIAGIKTNMKRGEAMCVLDAKAKPLPFWAYELQKRFFGKCGFSWVMCMFVFEHEGHLVRVTFHMFPDLDYTQVCLGCACAPQSQLQLQRIAGRGSSRCGDGVLLARPERRVPRRRRGFCCAVRYHPE